MKAVIMAGGKGTRLRPLTCALPKPMVPVAGRPMMEHVLDLLLTHGYRDLACTLCYMPDTIQSHFGDGASRGCSIRYSIEETPLGTAGSVRALGGFLDGTFLVISGDALTDIDLAAAAEFHKQKGAAVTIVLTRVETPLEYGVVIVDADCHITRFLEKPSWGEVFSDTVNTGIYVLEPDVMELVETARESDFSKNLFPRLLGDGYPMFGYVAEGYWCDVGNLEQYRNTHLDILDGRVRVGIPGELVDEGVWIGEGAEIETGAVLRPPVLIGPGARVEKGAAAGDYSVIGAASILAGGCSVRRSILWPSVFVGQNAQVHAAILASRVSVKAGASILEGAVVGSGSSIGERAQVKSGVKIWPDKAVDGGSQVNASLVWGASCSKRLFGRLGVAGLSNIEVTPDFSARLGAAYASCLPAGCTVTVSSDVHPASKMAKASLACGAMSIGVTVADLGDGTTAVARFAVPALQAAGGVHARISPADENVTVIEFLDSAGVNIDKALERKIENALLAEDYRRAPASRIGGLFSETGVTALYLDAIERAVDAELIRSARILVVAGYDEDYLRDVMSLFTEALGCTVIRTRAFGGAWAIAELADAVAAEGAHVGVLIDRNAERLALVDERGASVSNEDALALVCSAMLKSHAGGAVVVPVTAPGAIEKVAAGLRGRVVRSQANPRSMMEKAIEARVKMGEASVPQFQPMLDGVFALAVLLEQLAAEKAPLSLAARAMPRSYMTRRLVDCPWQSKGRVMRHLIEETDNENVQLIDGIKVYTDQGWTLILPDSEDPVFHVYSEAASQEIAEEIAGACISRIAEAMGDAE